MGTYFKTKEQAARDRKWYVIDAKGATVGRLASEISTLLRGKHKPDYTPHVDGGDFVVVVNAEKVVFTGRKTSDKTYYHHSGYIGGLKEEKASDVLKSYPERVLERAVKGMLPKGSLGRQMVGKLKVYAGEEHPHAAQVPQSYELKYSVR